MRKKYYIICLLLTLIGIRASDSFAADSGTYYYFEDNSDPAVPANSGEGLFNLHYLGDTQQTTTQAKFGKGSMLIGQKKGEAPVIIKGYGVASMPSEFNDGIRKMTISLWVRPAIQQEGSANSFTPGFLIFARYGGAGGVGVGYFMFAFAYKALEFNIYSESTGKIEKFRSAPVKYVESDEWIHLAMTFDEGKIVFYLNGLPISDTDASSLNVTTIPESQGKSIMIGFSNSRPGDCIDDFGFWAGTAASESDIDKIYNKGIQEFVKDSGKAPAAKK
ncbi:MAG: LamG-like jellyroll fold domain-containing protein [Chthoniobacterales bacterium]